MRRKRERVCRARGKREKERERVGPAGEIGTLSESLEQTDKGRICEVTLCALVLSEFWEQIWVGPDACEWLGDVGGCYTIYSSREV